MYYSQAYWMIYLSSFEQTLLQKLEKLFKQTVQQKLKARIRHIYWKYAVLAL